MKKCENPNCNNLTNNPKFCCRSCSAHITNKLNPKRKVEGNCLVCGIPISAQYKFCNEHKISGKMSEDIELKDIRAKNGHPSWRNARIREHARIKFKSDVPRCCEICGYDIHTEVCHIKPISSFTDNATLGEVNNRNNIKILCPNCHWEFDNGLLSIEEIRKSS